MSLWLKPMVIKLCKQMDPPVMDFSPQIQHMYANIHAYLTLLRFKEADKKYNNLSMYIVVQEDAAYKS